MANKWSASITNRASGRPPSMSLIPRRAVFPVSPSCECASALLSWSAFRKYRPWHGTFRVFQTFDGLTNAVFQLVSIPPASDGSRELVAAVSGTYFTASLAARFSTNEKFCNYEQRILFSSARASLNIGTVFLRVDDVNFVTRPKMKGFIFGFQ